MASGDVASKPRYSFRATWRGGLGLDRAARLEFYDDEMVIYRRGFHLLTDIEWPLFRHVKYSELRRCEYVRPKVESSRFTLGGFAWANMPAEIELSISRPGARSAWPGGGSFCSQDQLRFSGENMTEDEFRGMYSWLRTRMPSRKVR
jgi:hypothetical protein